MSSIFSLKLYNEAGKMPLKTQLFLFFIASILDILLMAYWEPPTQSDRSVIIFLPFAITLLALCVYMPLQYIIQLILPKIHHILQAFLAYFVIIFCFLLVFMLLLKKDFTPFSVFIYNVGRLFTSKETCGFINFPAGFFLLILSLIYTIKPPKLARQSSADILDDL